MPYASVNLKPGLNVEKTPTLNEAGYSAMAFGRWRDGLFEKLGGWSKYYPFAVGGVPRALHAWQDFNSVKRLGIGSTTALTVINDTTDAATAITPQQYDSNFTPKFSTTNTSPNVTVTDYNIANPTTYDSVEFLTPIAVGGLILFGVYPISLVLSATSFRIVAAANATATVSEGGAVPTFTTASGSASVTVTLASHGLVAGDSFVLPIATSVGGLSLVGTYSVVEVLGASSFSIAADALATSTQTLPMNYDGNDGFTKILLHADGADAATTFTDTNAGGSAHTWTAAGNAQIDTAQYKFGGASGLFDGTGDIVTTPDSADFTLGSGDFTVDFWFNVNGGAGTNRSAFGQSDNTGTAGFSIFGGLTTANRMRVGASANGTSFGIADITGTSTFTTTGWHHCAFVRSGSTFYLFIDGVQEGTATSATAVNNSASGWGFGSLGEYASGTWNGWLDEFRLSVGVARWTAAFTPQTYSYGGNARIRYHITIGPQSGSGTAYSFSTYSSGTYGGVGGSASQQTGTAITATDWTLDNWGQTFLSCPANGGLFEWTPGTGYQTAQLISGAPIYNSGMFVATPYPILIAYGCAVEKTVGVAQDPLAWRASDLGDYRFWQIGVINSGTGALSQAYSNRIPTGSAIKCGMATPNQVLLWTDLDLWSLTYLGSPLVWGQNKIGSQCGTISRHGAAQMAGVVYWWGQNNFFAMSGGAPIPLPCTVWDSVFQNLDRDNLDKCWVQPVSSFNEIWFFWPSDSGNAGQCDSYAKVNVVTGLWDHDTFTIPRSAGIDVSVLGNPIMATPGGVIYSHENGYNADGQPLSPSFTTGYFMLQDGQDFVAVDQWLPDFKFINAAGDTVSANIQVTFHVIDNMGDTPRNYGPHSMITTTPKLDIRFRGRQFAFTITSSDVGSWWRLGRCRFRFRPDGRR